MSNAPMLTGLLTSVSFFKDELRSGAKLIDSEVSFRDSDGDFDGGVLSVTGLLPEDVISIRDGGSNAGEIGFDGSNVTYGGVVIGTMVGGNGADCTITFNAAATVASIEALIENLTYSNSSDMPTASRELVLTVLDASGNSLSNGRPVDVTERTGASDPFSAVSSGNLPGFFLADLDNDGDLDLIGQGSVQGAFVPYTQVLYFENTGSLAGPSFNLRTGAANPFDAVREVGAVEPRLVDIDDDGDLDMVLGVSDFAYNPLDSVGRLRILENTGSATSPAFVERTGMANPFFGLNVGSYPSPSFADIDQDGDLDLITGGYQGDFRYFENTGSASVARYVSRTGAANPFDGLQVDLLSAPTFEDVDGDGDLDMVVGDSSGALSYFENTGFAAASRFVERTGGDNPFAGIDGGAFASPLFADLDGNGDSELVVGDYYGNLSAFDLDRPDGQAFTINVAVDSGTPFLSGLASAVSFDENTVNAAGALLDADVDFSDAEGRFQGGRLTVSGLLAEDVVSVRHVGTGAGEIGLSGSDVTYGGVTIGTLSGGAGADLTIAFNASATSAAVDALIENLTYANTSDTPTLSRELTVNVTDAAGGALDTGGPIVSRRANADNPFDGLGPFLYSPTVHEDFDNDGDLDLVVGHYVGRPSYFENTGSNTSPSYIERTGVANPFQALLNNYFLAHPEAGDMDGDGDLDLVVGRVGSRYVYYENTGTATSPRFVERAADANPFNGLELDGGRGVPILVDMEGDGDLDLVSMEGTAAASPKYYENTGTVVSPSFVERTGAANPFDDVTLPSYSFPHLADIDGDGDLDLVSGDYYGNLSFFENTGSAAAPRYVERSGARNPFAEVDLPAWAAPSFADIDGDGRLEMVIGPSGEGLQTYDLNPRTAPTITVTINAQDDPATARDDVFVTDADAVLTGDVFADNGSGADSDPEGDPFKVKEVNGQRAAVGQTITLKSGALLTLNEDGTFSYDANGAFDDLAAAGSGATNLSATDSFTYRINNGNDTATVTITLNGVDDEDVLHGTIGDDRLDGGAMADRYYGYNGDDVFLAGTGDLVFSGGGGEDTIVIGAHNLDLTGARIESVERIDGLGRGMTIQAGQLDGFTRFHDIGDITLATSGFTELGALLSGEGRVFAAHGDDEIRLNGNAGWTVFARGGNDEVYGTRGDDTLRGQGGDDLLKGGKGYDALFGDAGNDRLYGGDHGDVLEGGAGDDMLDGGDGKDTLFGGDGGDTLFGGRRADTLYGGGDRDVMFGNEGKDILHGEAGDDLLFGNEGHDTLFGDDGADSLHCNDGDDRAGGGAGNDRIWGHDGDDILTGGEGDDVLSGGAGRDVMRGEAGNDRFVYNLVSDSGTDALTRDRIRDFSEGDLIDLSAIDADVNAAGNQAFTFVNAFTGAGGEVMFDATTEFVLVDLDGDTVADMEIDLTNRTDAVIDETDFIL